ncbi:MAG TPA: hypothetical protein VHC21_00665 [Candidatus Saccharimonadales bacterium]|nr:hypothetical protein [Candidatus Saccharimonadales bacterium]
MSEQAPQLPDVDQAFDFEARHKQRDWEAYLNSRPTQGAEGHIHDPNTQAVNDSYFDDRREAMADEAAEKTQADYDYNHMSVPELTKKLAKAEFEKDKTTAQSIDEVLDKRLKALDKKNASDRDKGGTRSTRPENNAKNNNAERRANLRSRVAKLKERELERLAAESDTSNSVEGGGETELKSTYDETDAEADKQLLREAGNARREAQSVEEGGKPDDGYVPDWVKAGDDESVAGDQAEAKQSDEAATEVIEAEEKDESQDQEPAENTESPSPEELFQEALAAWNERLEDPRFVPTPEQYDELKSLTKQIELRHLDPETDDQSGMGYFLEGSSTRLNPYVARTLLDKSRAGEWILRPDDLDVATSLVEAENHEDIPLDETREERNDLMTFGEFISKDNKLQADQRSFRRYKRYVQKRLELDEYVYDENNPIDSYRPSLNFAEAVKDFRQGAPKTETEAESENRQQDTGEEAEASAKAEKTHHLGRVLLRNAGVLYDEIRESFRHSSEESGKQAKA